jgi:hypothetical protein
VLAILPTGSGKTGLFFMFTLVIKALSEDPSLCPQWKEVPKNPVMIAICPTNYIENQTVRIEIIHLLTLFLYVSMFTCGLRYVSRVCLGRL